MHLRRVALASASLALLLCVTAASASANRLRLTERALRITCAPMTTYLVLEPATTLTIPCNVTMEGSLHSASFSKVRGALIGYITRASVNASSCREGTVAFRSERLPWHIRYDVYAGILPN